MATTSISTTTNKLARYPALQTQMSIDDSNESIIYQISNLKIYSIDQSDRYSKRYELLASEGELKIITKTDNMLMLILSKTTNVQSRQFLNIPFKRLNFKDFKIRSNRLVVKYNDDSYYYGVETDLDRLIEIHGMLISLRDVYYPELAVIQNKKPPPIPPKFEVAAATATATPVADDNIARKRKLDDDEIKKLFDGLKQAIKEGNAEDASTHVKKLATYKLDVNITLNEAPVAPVVVDKVVVKKEETDNSPFNSHCLIIKENSDQQKNIYLENLDLNMKINDLKIKVLNEFKIPISSQYWIINDNAADDDFMLKFFITDKTNAKFQLFLPSDNPPPSSSKDDNKMDCDEKFEGWECNACTFINEPLRLECDVCGTRRPDDYVIPENLKKALNNEVKKLEQQKLNDYLAFDMQDLIENTEVFECDICMEDQVGPREGAVLKECLHIFCKGCLREHILHADDAVIKCPFSKDYVCEAVLQDREIRALVSPEEYKKVQLKSLKQGEAKIENTFHCKTPDCIGFCIFDDDLHWFECPVCEQTNCLRCDVVHMGKTCTEYREDLKIKATNDKVLEEDKKALENMVKKGEAMHCPGCKVLVLKDVGCDWMQCLMCKMEICWATRGPRWGPKGHGDTSGGCKCNTNGRLCHPKCGNCH